MNLKNKNTALIVIDVQEGVDHPTDGGLNNSGAEENILKLLDRWQEDDLPYFVVQYHSPRLQSPFHKDNPSSKLKQSVRSIVGDTIIIKHFESAFMKTDLEEKLRSAGIETVIFVGFFSDQCVASTAKVANNIGFRVIVVADATATTGCPGYYNGIFFNGEDIHNLTLGSLKRDGISIMQTSELL
jgi:nicotinamidase-related amidase